MPDLQEIHEANRRSWNHATARHNDHKWDQAASLRSGESTLFPEESDLLGDLSGKSLVHLQCNCGQDSLSIAKHLGAHVLGVDMSEEAISVAESLAETSGIKGSFIRANLFDWFAQPELPTVDVVFSSYGAIPWLFDIKKWGRGVERLLKPGGRFVLVEFHPLFFIFDDEGAWKPTFDCMGGAMVEDVDGVGDYVGDSGPGLIGNADKAAVVTTPYENPHVAYSFSWGLGDVIGALLQTGLRVTHLQEYPYCNGWRPFPEMIEKEARQIYLPEGLPKMPLMYSLVCEKPLF
ncbi:MAG: methyltransferase domain-containing protein [Verrucomicrobiaceae bacterium]|nr:methyltransferase domain-containing protein [Verrucomicrobiaceae bacterium]